MTAEELAQSLTTYGAGLQAELALLHQLEGLALDAARCLGGQRFSIA